MNWQVILLVFLGLMNLWIGYVTVAGSRGQVWLGWALNLPVGMLCLYWAVEAWK